MAWRGFRPRGDTGLRERIGHRIMSVSLGNKGRCSFRQGRYPASFVRMVDACGAQARHPPVIGALPWGRPAREEGGIIPPGWQENAHLCLAAGGKALYEP